MKKGVAEPGLVPTAPIANVHLQRCRLKHLKVTASALCSPTGTPDGSRGAWTVISSFQDVNGCKLQKIVRDLEQVQKGISYISIHTSESLQDWPTRLLWTEKKRWPKQ